MDKFERRKFSRTFLNNSVIIKSQRGEEISGASVNISAGGLMFTLPSSTEEFKMGDLIDVSFSPSLFGPVNIKAEVCHISLRSIIGKHEIRYGIKFLSFFQRAQKIIRHNTPFLTTISINETDTVDGLINEISFGGLQVGVPKYIRPNSRLKLAFKSKETQFQIPGLSIYCNPIDDNKMYSLGVCFSNFTSQEFEQFRQFIFSLK